MTHIWMASPPLRRCFQNLHRSEGLRTQPWVLKSLTEAVTQRPRNTRALHETTWCPTQECTQSVTMLLVTGEDPNSADGQRLVKVMKALEQVRGPRAERAT